MAAPTFLRHSARYLPLQFETANNVPGWVRGGGWLLWLGIYVIGLGLDSQVLHFLMLPAMFAFMSLTLSGDRRVYRILGMNRSRAMLQQLWISLPLALLVGAGTLLFIPLGAWPWAVLMAVALLSADLSVTAWLWGVSGTTRPAGALRWLTRPGSRGAAPWRLIWVPMLRWCLPAGVVSGLLLATVSFPGLPAPAAIAAAMLIFLGPALAYSGQSAAAATWQAFGLPRRGWAWAAMAAGAVSQVLGWLTALVIVGLAEWGGVSEAGRLAEVIWPSLSAGVLTLGFSAVMLHEQASRQRESSLVVGVILALILVSSFMITGTAAFALVVGAVCLPIAGWLQYRFIHNLGTGGRAVLGTPAFDNS